MNKSRLVLYSLFFLVVVPKESAVVGHEVHAQNAVPAVIESAQQVHTQDAPDVKVTVNNPLHSQLYNLASDNRMVSSINLNDLRSLVKSKGHNEVEAGMRNGQPYVDAKSEDGIDYSLLAQACSSETHCLGLNIRLDYPLMDTPNYERLNIVNVKHAAISVFISDQTLKVSRYLILDHGMTMRNIKLNMDVLLSGSQSAFRLYSDDEIPAIISSQSDDAQAQNDINSNR